MKTTKKSLILGCAVGALAVAGITGVAIAQGSDSGTNQTQATVAADMYADGLSAASLSIDGSTTCQVTQNGIDFESCTTDVWAACGLTKPQAANIVDMASIEEMLWEDEWDVHDADFEDGEDGQGDDFDYIDEELMYEMLMAGDVEMLLDEGFEEFFGFELSEETRAKAAALIDEIETEAFGQFLSEELGLSAEQLAQATFVEPESFDDGRYGASVWGPGAMTDMDAAPQMLLVETQATVTFDFDCQPQVDAL